MFSVRAFLRSLVLSCTSLSYYEEVFRTPLSFSWKFFVALHMCIGAVIAVLAAVALQTVQPALHGVGSSEWQSMIQFFPPALSLRMQDGVVLINQPLPYVIPITQDMLPAGLTSSQTQDFHAVLEQNNLPVNAFTFIDRDTVDTDTFRQYHSFGVISRRQVAQLESLQSTSISVTTLPNISIPFAITRARLEGFTWLVTTFHLTDRGAFGIFVFVTMFIGISVVMMIVSFLRNLAVVFAVFLFWHKKIRYWKLYQLTIHASTPLILLSGLVFLPITIPFLLTILRLSYFVWISVILRRLQQRGLLVVPFS